MLQILRRQPEDWTAEERNILVHLAKNEPFFENMPDVLYFETLLRMKHVHADPRDILMKENDPPDGFYVIIKGRIALFKNSDGEGAPFKELQRGCLGEAGLLTGNPRPATAIARVASELLWLSKTEYLRLLSMFRRGELSHKELEGLAHVAPGGRTD